MKPSVDHLYILAGLILLVFAGRSFMDRGNPKRLGTGMFWFVYGLTFLLGGLVPPGVIGLMVVVLALIGSFNLMGRGSYPEKSREEKMEAARKLGNRIFIPALCIPLVTFLVAKLTDLGALVGLGVGTVAAFILALLMLRERPYASVEEGRRLMDAIGWSAILSQFLAALGFLFDKAGVGAVVAGMVSSVVPSGRPLLAVVAYCVGMALFTMVMGNAFAAFAVITTGIGIPMVVSLGADPSVVGVIGMLSGYCGTLMTPMAANFNVVPAALLELKDKNGVIKAQVPVALFMLAANVTLMYFLAF
ncbi:MAG: DUF979 domain-containing protein [Thermanaerothrix sp.]|nr:DUF979 domain-containing protein [Thermanaerothrix sp.]